ncbi:hypothetical protein Cpir12675_005292 [Ceratocystis pirilliformis]|uniref:Uncharacterized protein n=1 Tax=Ceratocystis pirilliformis TaxID=259994 RepID=A0ABR3YRP3_9PEZI
MSTTNSSETTVPSGSSLPASTTTTSEASVATTTVSSAQDGSNSSVSIGAVIGMLAGALFLIAMGAFFVLLRRRRLRKMGIHDSEAHLHETVERTPPRPTTIIEIHHGRRRRQHRGEEWVEPPPTYQEAHADGVVPAYEEQESGSDQDEDGRTGGSRSPLHRSHNLLRSLSPIHLRSPISIRSLRMPRTPGSLRSPARSRVHSPVHSRMHSPVRSPGAVVTEHTNTRGDMTR